MARQKQPTIQEVSRRSGVSVATVSRVLHGESGRFSPDTEKKVREASRFLTGRFTKIMRMGRSS